MTSRPDPWHAMNKSTRCPLCFPGYLSEYRQIFYKIKCHELKTKALEDKRWPVVARYLRWFQDERVDREIEQTRARVTQNMSATKYIGCLVVVIINNNNNNKHKQFKAIFS